MTFTPDLSICIHNDNQEKDQININLCCFLPKSNFVTTKTKKEKVDKIK